MTDMAHWLQERLILLIPLWMSLSVHEWAHAWSAFHLGDDTAARMGRMTINPLAHIDPVGTLLLPLLGIPFGWAVPVPVQPLRFHRGISMQMGMLITAAAGPLANVVLAVGCTAALAAVARFLPHLAIATSLQMFLVSMIQLNVLLAAFNLLPVPPLDGSRIADAFMPAFLRPAWLALQAAGPIGLLVALVLLNSVFAGFFQIPLHLAQWLVRVAVH